MWKISAVSSADVFAATVPENLPALDFINGMITALADEFNSNPAIFKDAQPNVAAEESLPAMTAGPHISYCISLYREFMRRITSGSYNPDTDDQDIPPGYLQYCVSSQGQHQKKPYGYMLL